MEASGGYERSWAEHLRAAGVKVRIVDPETGASTSRKSAGRLAKNDPIDAETIAWFAETFAEGQFAQPYDPEREALDRPWVKARSGFERAGGCRSPNGGEHNQPDLVAKTSRGGWCQGGAR